MVMLQAFPSDNQVSYSTSETHKAQGSITHQTPTLEPGLGRDSGLKIRFLKLSVFLSDTQVPCW